MGRSRSKSATPRPGREAYARSQQEDDSIGSALSLRDQFDILVPIKIPDRTRSGKDGDAQSDVSSITTDEHKKMLKYLLNAQAGRRNGICSTSMSSLCCCTEMTTGGEGKHGGGAKKTNRKKKNGLVDPAVSTDKTCDISRSQYSLFDALSEEDEEDDDENLRSTATDDQAMMDSPIKRKRSWRKSIRKKMPWASKK